MREDQHENQDFIEGDEQLSFTLTDDEIRQIAEAVRAQDPDTVHAILDDLNPGDVAEVFSKVGEDIRAELLAMYGEAINPEVFTEMDPELARSILTNMNAAQVATIIAALESDDALLLIEQLDDDFQKEIIRKLSAKTRMAVEEGLAFPEDSAGRLMQREVVAIPQFWTVGKTIDYLRAAAEDLPEEFYDIFIIDPAYHVRGQVSLSRIVRAKRTDKVETLIEDDIQTIPADMDQEEVAHLFRREDITSSPVVDHNGRLLGVITIDDVIDVIDEEAQEDILKMGGVGESDIYRPVLSTTGTRFRWLFINLITAIAASVVISFFDATIEQVVALAVLMPIVASMGGNAGTQSLTVAVRALATKELSGANTWRIIGKETLVGMLNGAAFAIIAGLVAALWFSNPTLGIIIAAAMIINLIFAGFCGAAIPIILDRAGSDPAVSSTVFLTTVTDIVGFFAFLGLAAAFLI